MKTLEVTALENGTVMDHIQAGCALDVLNLALSQLKQSAITVGMYLPSARHEKKDIIKMHAYHPSDAELELMGVLAPGATVNFIENFKVVKKVQLALPQEVKGLFQCQNSQCISIDEDIEPHFHIHTDGEEIILKCHYCEHEFKRSQVSLRARV